MGTSSISASSSFSSSSSQERNSKHSFTASAVPTQQSKANLESTQELPIRQEAFWLRSFFAFAFVVVSDLFSTFVLWHYALPSRSSSSRSSFHFILHPLSLSHPTISGSGSGCSLNFQMSLVLPCHDACPATIQCIQSIQTVQGSCLFSASHARLSRRLYCYKPSARSEAQSNHQTARLSRLTNDGCACSCSLDPALWSL